MSRDLGGMCRCLMLISLWLPALGFAACEGELSEMVENGVYNPRYTRTISFGEIKSEWEGQLTSLVPKLPLDPKLLGIVRVRDAPQSLLLGFVISSDKIITDVRNEQKAKLQLPNSQATISVTDDRDRVLVNSSINLAELWFEDASYRGVPNDFLAEFLGTYRSFAQPLKARDLTLEVSPNRTYCYKLVLEKGVILPPGVRVFAAAVQPGWKRVN